MSKSVIVIGGGLGGLFTGAILAKEGVNVTVIEKNPTVGGGLQSFTRMGETFDTGMHVIGGMQRGGNIRRICEYLGIMDRVHLADVDPKEIDTLYFAEDQKTYRLAQGRQEYIDALTQDFPAERDEITAYVDAMFALVDEIDLFHLRPSADFVFVHSDEFMMSGDEFIAKYIQNEHLRSVVAYMNPLYSGRGGMTPAYIHALISVLYIEGPSRFAGGSQLFANTLGDYIQEHQGQVITGDGVSHVHSQDRFITGVTTRKGRNLQADQYVCAIHPCIFFELLDNPSVFPKSYRSRLSEIPNSYSAFTLNIKLRPGTFRYINHSCYYMSRYDQMWNFGKSHSVWPLGFLYMTPPELEQGEYSTKMIVTAPMLWQEVAQWADTRLGHRTPEYEAWKHQHAEMLLDRMEEMYPGFRNCVQDYNTASPLTIRDWYGVKEGAMCGFSKDCRNITLSQVPVVTKVPNLFLTGQNCNLHGFCGVPLTAINTCEAILGRNYILNRIKEFEAQHS